MDDSDDEDVLLDHFDDLDEETLVQIDSKTEGGDASRRSKKKFVANFDVAGVQRVTLDDVTQEGLRLKVGVDVTSLRPWKHVAKESLLDDVAVRGDDSAVAPFKADVEALEADETLMGYIFDETEPDDRFYLCLTVDAIAHCDSLAAKVIKRTLKKLDKYIHKSPKTWTSCGGGDQVDDFVLTVRRPKIKVELKFIVPKERQSSLVALSPDKSYTELVSADVNTFRNVIKKRIDVGTQAIPEKRSMSAQTEPKFPHNVWTQSENDTDIVETTGEIVLGDSLLEMLRVLRFNIALDVYNPDYPSLIKNPVDESRFEGVSVEDHVFFVTPHTGQKMVSSMCWHPQLEGVLAASYLDAHFNVIELDANLKELLFERHIVLAWSLSDTLTPKLFFQTVEPVTSLSFCPTELNILIGGSASGKIFVWDFGRRLETVVETLTTSEQRKKFKIHVQSQRKPFKEYDDSNTVAPLLTSEAFRGHRDKVTDIAWIPDRCKVDVCGKIYATDGDETSTNSLQFITVSLDGHAVVWQLKVGVEVSPIYKIVTEQLPLTTVQLRQLREAIVVDYLGREPDRKPSKLPLLLGTLHGEVCQASWVGQDVEPETADVPSERFKFDFRESIHDGPVVACVPSPFIGDICCTVGGKVFCVWSERLSGRPLLWKKVDRFLTGIAWSLVIPTQLFLMGIDGRMDVWDFSHRSDAPLLTKSISGVALTTIAIQKEHLAIGDRDGVLRMLKLTSGTTYDDDFFEREFVARAAHVAWQDKWYELHREEIEKRAAAEKTRLKEEDRRMKLKARKDLDKRQQDEERARAEVKPISAQQRWTDERWQHTVHRIQLMKQLDRAGLLKAEKPLRDLQAQRAAMAKAQTKILATRGADFDHTVDILYPEVTERPPLQQQIVLDRRASMAVLQSYEDIAETARRAIAEDPFLGEFDRRRTIAEAAHRWNILMAACNPTCAPRSTCGVSGCME